MAFNENFKGGLPKGKLVPMYLTDEGELFPILFTGEEQMDLVATMIGIAMDHRIVVDTHTKINDEPLMVYERKIKKIS